VSSGEIARREPPIDAWRRFPHQHPETRTARQPQRRASHSPEDASASAADYRSAIAFNRERSRNTAFVWIWHTRDSVIPRMFPISFMLRSS